MLLQNSRPCEWASISTNIVDPVVVKPDIDSKKESIGGMEEKRYGREPKIAAKSHPRATIRRASLSNIVLSSFFVLKQRIKIEPITIEIAMG
jgi:hypothetical protein